VDASAGGLGLLCDEAIRVGEEVRLLVVAGRRIARLSGRVARCRCLGDGEFLHGVILSEPSAPGHDLLFGGPGEQKAAPGENLC